jgi:hypothetical protein
MDIKTAMAMSLLGIKKDDVDALMSISDDKPIENTTPKPDIKPDIKPDKVIPPEPDTTPETTDYKKLYDELKTTSDKLQSDLKALQAQNIDVNIEPDNKKETLTDIFKDIL